MASKKGKLFILSGPSGVGKGSLSKILLADDGLNVVFSTSATTREPREGEENGKDYFFMSKEKFANMIKKDKFIEYAKFVDNYYGTPREAVENLLSSGKNVILEIEVQGAIQVITKDPKVVSIFIAPPNIEELKKRLMSRGSESKEVIEARIEQAKFELALKSKYSHVVVNDELIKCAAKIAAIIRGK